MLLRRRVTGRPTTELALLNFLHHHSKSKQDLEGISDEQRMQVDEPTEHSLHPTRLVQQLGKEVSSPKKGCAAAKCTVTPTPAMH